MEPVHATVAPRNSFFGNQLDRAGPSSPSNPAELRDLMAAANAAASVPASQDFAIWEDAMRQLAVGQRPAAIRTPILRGPRTVIVVDHSTAERETMRQALVGAGYTVVLAEDGIKALAAAREQTAHLVITDVEIPAMDGIELIVQLRQFPAHRYTPIMMLTGPAQDARKIAGRRAGATGWISKPFEPQRFVAIVQQVCPVT